MRVKVKQGCSVGVDGHFYASGVEVVLPVHEVVKHLASLAPAEEAAETFFAACQAEAGNGGGQ
jgi:hypothetical protein